MQRFSGISLACLDMGARINRSVRVRSRPWFGHGTRRRDDMNADQLDHITNTLISDITAQVPGSRHHYLDRVHEVMGA